MGRGADGLGVKYPSVPAELIYALTVNVDNLRPWEFDAMPADQYDEIVSLWMAWSEARAAERKTIAKAGEWARA